jgi:diguanylate cyclase (GGDEF)-like protein/PAS domain S-box-containing protein
MHNPERLLVVDDDAYNRDLLSRRLIRRGYDVACAADGREALTLIEQEHFDLVLLDNMMPGLSGLDLLRLLRATYTETDLPVIMVTAQSESDNIVQALKAGANDYVIKPVDFPVAAARIQSELTRRTAAVALRESEERYALAARGANDGLWDWDVRSGKVYYSERWKSMLGFASGELSDSPEEWLSRVCPADRERVRGSIQHHLESTQTEWQSDYRIAHRDGSLRWMRSRAISSRDKSGQVIRFTGSQSDVTHAMTIDALTGLGNRAYLVEGIERALAAPSGPRYALLFLDLDGFKLVNDSLGHMTGDRLLAGIAQRLQQAVAEYSVEQPAIRVYASRLGGDEFALLMTSRQPFDPATLADRILYVISERFQFEGRDVFTGVSIGIAIGNPAYHSAEEILRDADTALYRAKTRGRGRVEIFDPSMRANAMARMEMETGLRHALERNELRVYYQPKVDLRSGALIGFEALARWMHPQRGMISPGEFIPVAEETGLIVPIGLWALEEGCRQMCRWIEREPRAAELALSVNLSLRQFSQPDLCECINRVLQQTGFPAERLCLEITESVLAEDMEGARATLDRLKAAGIGLKLDDFGTGYSSLSYLCRLPFDSLKIDRSFVMRMNDSQETAGIIRTIVNLAHDLHLDIIAEGIETRDQMLKLQELGCQYGQGFYFGRPVSPEDVSEQLISKLKQGLVLTSLDDAHQSNGNK